MNASPIRASVRLDGDMVLRIRDGRGTRLRCAGGVVWVTQQGSANDTVLDAGADMTVEFDGTTLAGAHHGTSVVVEVQSGIVPPGLVETADRDGRERRLFSRGSRRLALLQRALARAIAILKAVNNRGTDLDAARTQERRGGVSPHGIRCASLRKDETGRNELLAQSTLWRQT